VVTKAHTSKGIVLALSRAAKFMGVLDIAIVNVALPSIQQDLGRRAAFVGAEGVEPATSAL
jgi:hypothetical protein